eukprot:6212552-Pleurochrysis_carterae.AAC.2
MSKRICVKVAGAKDGAQGGVAVEQARKMFPDEELLYRPRLLCSHSGSIETLVSQVKDIVRRGILPVARLPLRCGQVGRSRGPEERGIHRATRGA